MQPLELFFDLHSDDLKYSPEHKSWFVWNECDCKWKKDPQGLRTLHTAKNVHIRLMEISRLTMAVVKNSGDKALLRDARKIEVNALKMGNYAPIIKMINSAKRDPRFRIKGRILGE